MDEVFASLSKYFSSKARTQVYGIFGFWWIVFHWEFFYTALFVSQGLIFQQTHLLKNDYLKQHFYDYQYISFWVAQTLYFAFSVGLTWLMIWVIPSYVLIKAYDREQSDRLERLKVKLRYEEDINTERTELEKKRTDLERKTVTRLKATERKIEKENEVTKSTANQWGQDYYSFSKTTIFNFFNELVDSLYRYGGHVHVAADNFADEDFDVNTNLLAYADTNDLISYDRARGIISLTDKGKFFVKSYQSDRSRV